MASLLRATALLGYADLVGELGGDADALLRRFHLTLGVEHQEEAFVPFDAVVRLLDASADELGCPEFGLRMAAWQGMDVLGPVAVIARNAQTVQDGLAAIARYLYMHSPAMKLDVEVRGNADLRFTYEMSELALPLLRQGYEVSMGDAVQMVRLLGGPGAGVSVVSFLHEQMGPDAAYAEALGCPVRFGQSWCGFEVPAALAARPIDWADPETRRIATAYLESKYLPVTASLSDRVAELARRLLPTGTCTADAIAEHLGLHPRTLQRRLAEEGPRCQDLIESERRALAARYLAEPLLQLGQVAGLLGYAEQSTLNRSCRRWFGMTPRQYRASLTA
jgi:AraC-like DNA-binding protein